MAQITCNVCNKNFKTEEELRDHQRTAHGTSKQESERPAREGGREVKIAS